MTAPALGPVVLLTGAGASKPLGYPTTVEFFADPESVPRTYAEIYEKVRQRVGSPPQVDVEDLLRILQSADDFLRTEAGKFLGPMLQKNWARLVPEFTRFTRDRCFELYGKTPKPEAVRDLYLPLLELCGWQRHAVDLFTANYDPVTDFLMETAANMGLRGYDGFGDLARWDSERYEWSAPGLRIFRLHGSMSWVRDGDRIVNTRDYNLRQNPTHRHLLIYPGFKGDPETDGVEEVFTYAHQRFRSALKSAAVLVAIGFSFRDDAINRVLVEAMQSNPSLFVVLLNPEFPDGSDGIIRGLAEEGPATIRHIARAFGTEEATKELRDALPP